MKDEEEKPIVENRLPCPLMLLIIVVVWAVIIIGCIKMCN